MHARVDSDPIRPATPYPLVPFSYHVPVYDYGSPVDFYVARFVRVDLCPAHSLRTPTRALHRAPHGHGHPDDYLSRSRDRI